MCKIEAHPSGAALEVALPQRPAEGGTGQVHRGCAPVCCPASAMENERILRERLRMERIGLG